MQLEGDLLSTLGEKSGGSERHDAVTGGAMFAGIPGVVATSVVTSNSQNTGPADLFPLDEAAAKTTLAELQLAQ